MVKLIDRMGQRYERLVVTGRAPNKSEKDTNARWHCRCDCGRMVIAYGQDLAKGKFKSCGCLNAQRIFKHGMARTQVYRVWKGMHARCRSMAEKNYGARSIKVSPEWDDFENFYRDMGDPPKGAWIEREDNDGPYCKANCRWASRKEQLNNTRRTHLLTAFGKTQSMMQWAEEYGLNWFTLRERIDRCGWSIEDALTEPIRPGKALNNR